jgi:hypothetical protein
MALLVLIKNLFQTLPTSSLTDTEYDEIISLAIKRAMTGGVPSPFTELDTGHSDMEDEIEVKTTVFIMVKTAALITN